MLILLAYFMTVFILKLFKLLFVSWPLTSIYYSIHIHPTPLAATLYFAVTVAIPKIDFHTLLHLNKELFRTLAFQSAMLAKKSTLLAMLVIFKEYLVTFL